MAETMQKLSAINDSLTLESWESKWAQNLAGWHEEGGNKVMWKHFPNLLAKSFPDKQPSELKVFVPLCGKAKDMFLLYEKGFTVVGVEFTNQAIEEFFAENSIATQKDPAINSSSTQKYTVSEDGRMIIGHGDLFKFTSDNLPFSSYDVIWDRGSFEALNQSDRGRYSALTTSLLEETGFYLMNTCDYDTAEFGGPPLAADMNTLKQYFGEAMNIELLDKTDMLENEHFRSQGITRIDGLFHVMKRIGATDPRR